MKTKKDISNKSYGHYNDYHFKSILQKRANGLLKFVNIPYRIEREIISEFANLGPSISRIDFVGEAENNKREVTLILECQSELPTDEDIKRFFQYVASLRVFKDNDVELYILCTKKAPYNEKNFVIKEGCTYTMHVISLKDFEAKEIFKNIEDKLKNEEEISDEDIASLQLIIYTDFEESELEILNKARELLEKISEKLIFDINEKLAIIYLFDMLSVNMLDDDEHEKYMEVNSMLVNPRDRYFKNKGLEEGIEKGEYDAKLETAGKLLDKGYPIEEIVDVTGLSKNDILNAK